MPASEVRTARNRRGGPVWPPEPPTQGRPYGFTDCKGSWNFNRRHEDSHRQERGGSSCLRVSYEKYAFPRVSAGGHDFSRTLPVFIRSGEPQDHENFAVKT